MPFAGPACDEDRITGLTTQTDRAPGTPKPRGYGQQKVNASPCRIGQESRKVRKTRLICIHNEVFDH